MASEAEAVGFIARELRHLWPPTLFFFVAFNLLALTAQLSGAPGGLLGYATASLTALVCGKAVLLADRLPFFNRFPERPLIWNVVWKALLCSALSSVIRLAEHGVEAWNADRHLGAGARALEASFTWSHFTMIQLWLAVLFLVYAAFGEIAGVLGRDRMQRMFFGPMEPRDVR